MVQMHVDDLELFDQARLELPLGGEFNLKWPGRPKKPPSAPPKDLPDPAVRVLSPEEAAVTNEGLRAALMRDEVEVLEDIAEEEESGSSERPVAPAPLGAPTALTLKQVHHRGEN